MDTPLKTFDPNEKGRDFVIGDLHGSMPCFEKLLEGLNFDEEKDRMFSVGDLVDRGPESMDCLRLLNKPWFQAVLSNHEQMMYEAFNGGYMGAFWQQNGGRWGHGTLDMSRDLQNFDAGNRDAPPRISDMDLEILDLVTLIGQLPFLITVNNKSGKKYHIIHAEMPPGVLITDSMLSSPGKVEALATHQARDGDVFLWGRYKFMQFYKADLSNTDKIIRTLKYSGGTEFFNDQLSHIISGHTIMQRPVTLVGQTNIDTGAYESCIAREMYEKVPKWAGLTCINLDDWTFYKATPTEFKEVEPLTINSCDIS